jgi:meso-butanediol dehydrogenase/(S,S)-butanediol dehydrogenase/diacetyl reductase
MKMEMKMKMHTENSSLRFAGKVIVITAAASGIGLACAKRFYSEGATICLSDKDYPALQASLDVRGMDASRVSMHELDVSRYDDVKAYIETIGQVHQHIDVLVNNAGMGSWGAVQNMAVERWHAVIAVTLDSVFYTCKEAMPYLILSHGSIVNTASISGLFGDNGFAAYNAAKAGVINLTRTLALDHAADGVRANAICPGLTDTPRVAWMKASPDIVAEYDRRWPMKRAGRPEEMAAVIAFLASEDASYVTGVALAVDGGLTASAGQPPFLRLLPNRK